jgi:hypothetical protein
VRVFASQPVHQPAQALPGDPDGLRAVKLRLEPDPEIAFNDGPDQGRTGFGQQVLLPPCAVYCPGHRWLGDLIDVEQQDVEGMDLRQMGSDEAFAGVLPRHLPGRLPVERGAQLREVLPRTKDADPLRQIEQVYGRNGRDIRVTTGQQQPSDSPGEVGAGRGGPVPQFRQPGCVGFKKIEINTSPRPPPWTLKSRAYLRTNK